MYQGLCTHKPLFPDFYAQEIIGTIVLMIIMALSTMAGIGGGGIVILLIKEFLVFQLKRSISLSQFSIFACSVTRYILNFTQKHPEKKTSISLDYGLATIMMPTVICGSFIGAILNSILPDIIIQGILGLLLFFLAFQAGVKASQMIRKENKAKKEKKEKEQQIQPLQAKETLYLLPMDESIKINNTQPNNLKLSKSPKRMLSEREGKHNEDTSMGNNNNLKPARTSVNFDFIDIDRESQESSLAIRDNEANELDNIIYDDIEVGQGTKRVKSYRLTVDGTKKRYNMNHEAFENMMRLKEITN